MNNFVKYTESTTLEKMMAEYDMEEAHYWWVVSDVCSLIRRYGYTKVLMDIDKSLKADDLEVEILNAIEDGSTES